MVNEDTYTLVTLHSAEAPDSGMGRCAVVR